MNGYYWDFTRGEWVEVPRCSGGIFNFIENNELPIGGVPEELLDLVFAPERHPDTTLVPMPRIETLRTSIDREWSW